MNNRMIPKPDYDKFNNAFSDEFVRNLIDSVLKESKNKKGINLLSGGNNNNIISNTQTKKNNDIRRLTFLSQLFYTHLTHNTENIKIILGGIAIRQALTDKQFKQIKNNFCYISELKLDNFDIFKLEEIYYNFEESRKEIKKILNDYFPNIFQQIKQKQNGGGLFNIARRTASAVGTGISKTASVVGTGISKTASAVGTGISKTASAVGTGISKTASAVGKRVVNTASAVGTGISKTASAVSKTASAVSKKAYEKLIDLLILAKETSRKICHILDEIEKNAVVNYLNEIRDIYNKNEFAKIRNEIQKFFNGRTKFFTLVSIMFESTNDIDKLIESTNKFIYYFFKDLDEEKYENYCRKIRFSAIKYNDFKIFITNIGNRKLEECLKNFVNNIKKICFDFEFILNLFNLFQNLNEVGYISKLIKFVNLPKYNTVIFNTITILASSYNLKDEYKNEIIKNFKNFFKNIKDIKKLENLPFPSAILTILFTYLNMNVTYQKGSLTTMLFPIWTECIKKHINGLTENYNCLSKELNLLGFNLKEIDLQNIKSKIVNTLTKESNINKEKFRPLFDNYINRFFLFPLLTKSIVKKLIKSIHKIYIKYLISGFINTTIIVSPKLPGYYHTITKALRLLNHLKKKLNKKALQGFNKNKDNVSKFKYYIFNLIEVENKMYSFIVSKTVKEEQINYISDLLFFNINDIIFDNQNFLNGQNLLNKIGEISLYEIVPNYFKYINIGLIMVQTASWMKIIGTSVGFIPPPYNYILLAMVGSYLFLLSMDIISSPATYPGKIMKLSGKIKKLFNRNNKKTRGGNKNKQLINFTPEDTDIIVSETLNLFDDIQKYSKVINKSIVPYRATSLQKIILKSSIENINLTKIFNMSIGVIVNLPNIDRRIKLNFINFANTYQGKLPIEKGFDKNKFLESFMNTLNNNNNNLLIEEVNNINGGSKYIYIKNVGKRKVRYLKNGKPYVIINGKKKKI